MLRSSKSSPLSWIRKRLHSQAHASSSSVRDQNVALSGVSESAANISIPAQGLDSAHIGFTTNATPPQCASSNSLLPSAQNSQNIWTVALEQLSKGSQEEQACIQQLHKAELLPTVDSRPLVIDKHFIDDVHNQLKRRLSESDKAAFEIPIRKRTYRIRDALDKTIVWLNAFKEVGDIAVNYDPVHAALPWAAFRFLLQTMTIGMQQSAEMAIGLEKSIQLSLRGSIYEQMYLDCSHDEPQLILQAALLDLYRAVIMLMSDSVKYQETSTLRKAVAGALKPQKFTTRLDALDAKAAWVETAANNCYRQKSLRQIDMTGLRLQELLERRLDGIDTKLAEVWSAIQDRNRFEVMQWISHLPYESDFANVKATRLQGTCDWLLAHSRYIQWRQSNGSKILWLHGIPGSGKTRLTSRVLEELVDDPLIASGWESLAYFFCDRNRHDRQDPAAVLRSLVRQLSFQPGTGVIMTCTRNLYTTKQMRGFASSELTMDECQSLLTELTRDRPRTTIVIDGLDECNHKSRHALLEGLALISTTASRGVVKILIASRDDDDIKDQFGTGERLKIQASDNQEDIEKFITSKMESSRWCSQRMSRSTYLEVLNTFKRKSQGMFQWAALHIVELLELKSDSLVLEYLHKLPAGLEETYRQIYESIDKRKRRLADRAFQWVMCSWKPLSPQELVTAVIQDPSKSFNDKIDIDIDMLLESCKNLLVIEDGGDGMFCRFAHLSVQEYLELHHFTNTEAVSFILDVNIKYLSEETNEIRAPKLWHERMNMWHRQVGTVDGKVLPATRDAMKEFLGHPTESSPAYRRWGQGFLLYDKNSYGLDILLRRRNERGEEYGISWVSCVVFGIFDVLEDWVLSGTLKPEEMVYGPYSALGLASHWNQSLIWDLLATLRVDINLPTGSFVTALFEAIAGGDARLPKAELLLQHGADLSIQDNHFGTVLQMAAGGGSLCLVKLLTSHAADVNIVAGHYGTAIEAAATNSHLEVCQLLLENGADVNICGGIYHTPLMAAVKQADHSIAKVLLQAGADVNEGDSQNTRPLHEAILWGLSDLTKLLIDHGADVNAVSSRYGTPLYTSTSTSHPTPNIIRLLLDAGAHLGECNDVVAIAQLESFERGELALWDPHEDYDFGSDCTVDLAGLNQRSELENDLKDVINKHIKLQ
ncbi:hypothetical protein F4678DRAFT_433483 [Xylaria arbuscula]|nr:hypothetical protein F4678DRAFT_433483 [Xylaria arbuscula]